MSQNTALNPVVSVTSTDQTAKPSFPTTNHEAINPLVMFGSLTVTPSPA